MIKLPEFKPLPDVNNLSSNYMSAFNQGMNIYEALLYLQGYVQITYNSMDDLLNDWDNFEQYVAENISQIANEKTQEILDQWKSDGTLNEIIAQNPLWNQKVNKAGDVMSGDLQFQENKGVYGTLHSGDKVNMISHSYTGSDDYTQIGDIESQAVVRSKGRPVWYDGAKNQDLIVEDDLNEINSKITVIQENAETGVYWNDNGNYDILQDYGGNHQTKFLKPSDIIDNLTSTNKDKALAAKQGKILKDGMDAVFGNVKKFRAGQIILSFNGTSAQIFTKDQVDEILGVTDSGGTNVILLVQNADLNTSDSKNLIAAYYNESSQKWGVHFDGTVNGGAKVNYMLVYF